MSGHYIATVGVFDGCHVGHRHLLEFLVAKGRATGLPTEVITFRNHPLSVVSPERQPPLLQSVEERVAMLRGMGIDCVRVLDFTEDLRRMSAAEFVGWSREHWGVEALVVGFNNHLGSDRVGGAESLAELSQRTGVAIYVCDEYPETPASSTAARETLACGRVEDTARILGRAHVLRGRVVRGHRIGRTLGFPTANICPGDAEMLVPADGVYGGAVTLEDGTRHVAVINVGVRPTVGGDNERTIEAHMPGFVGDIYGQNVKVEFTSFIRPERRFDSLDELREAIRGDIERVLGRIN